MEPGDHQTCPPVLRRPVAADSDFRRLRESLSPTTTKPSKTTTKAMQKLQLITILAATIGGLLVVNRSHAAPVQWTTGPGATGHFYEVIASTGINWQDAQNAALASGGYLATITSSQENAFVFALADNPIYWFTDGANNSQGPWLGGFQPAGSPEPAGNFQWVNGEGLFGFTAWNPGEPNNSGGAEDSLLYFANGPGVRSSNWNDGTGTSSAIRGYVVESVPEPSSCVLAVFGLISVVSLHRRSRNQRIRNVA